MAKAFVSIDTVVPAPCPLTEQLKNADKAWQNLMCIHQQIGGENNAANSHAFFAAFSCFAGKLIENEQLRKMLMKSFDLHVLHTGMLSGRIH